MGSTFDMEGDDTRPIRIPRGSAPKPTPMPEVTVTIPLVFRDALDSNWDDTVAVMAWQSVAEEEESGNLIEVCWGGVE